MTRLASMLAAILLGALLWLLLAWAVYQAAAHEAPSGWSYPSGCCSGIHCAPLPAEDVQITPEGYLIVPTGEVIPFNVANTSPDSEYHYCTKRDRHPPPGVQKWDRVNADDELHKESRRPHERLNRSNACFWAPEYGS